MTSGWVLLAERDPSELAGAPNTYLPLIVAVTLGAVGIWLLLPRGGRPRPAVGALVASVGLAFLAHYLPWLGDWVVQVLFWLLAGVTVVSAVATISMRSPVYSAIWFALTLLTTAGLLLLQGAQFLSVATVIVYAGAILVTFLFVLMLAQPDGHATYDRVSWGTLAPVFATVSGVLIVGGLTYTVANLDAVDLKVTSPQVASDNSANEVLHPQHMAKLGGQLFSRHLLSVEVAGTLLLVALVGAIAIVIQSKEQRSAASSEPALTSGGSRDA